MSYPYFGGKDWPCFHVRPDYRRNRDGAPVIYCVTDTTTTFIITVERWLYERRTGGIVELKSPWRRTGGAL